MLKLQYFGHLMRRADSLEKTLMLGKIDGRRRMRWMDGITNSWILHKLTTIELVMLSNNLNLCHPLLLPSIFPSIRVFSMSQFFASGGQSIGASASIPVLPMNIQDWFSSGLTGLVSLQSKGLSRVFPSTTIWKHQFFSAHPSYGTTPTSVWPLENL